MLGKARGELLPGGADYAALDSPEVLRYIFHPRRDIRRAPPGSSDHLIPVESGVSIGCRFYSHHPASPSILFFHGNGEVVGDYDDIAPFYNRIGTNLFVVDYRGYGSSGGTPTFTSMVGDSHRIFNAFLDIRRNEHYIGGVWAMGRSLGSTCAIELAANYPEEIEGLIVESGFGSAVRLLKYLGFPELPLAIDPASTNSAKMSSIIMPTLILHGERDILIPVAEASSLYENTAAGRKRLVIISGAGHNDIMLVDINRYFGIIRDFVVGE